MVKLTKLPKGMWLEKEEGIIQLQADEKIYVRILSKSSHSFVGWKKRRKCAEKDGGK